ncbi:MAG: Ig-like domain-containing protein [Gemmatimonadota bacterium]|nr:MAG: Ig-like domain-containing protein [Gemmatimonadota bacterium]
MRSPHLAFVLLTLALPVQGQEDAAARVARLEARPGGEILLTVGQSRPFQVIALDAAGEQVDVRVTVSAPRGALQMRRGRLTALQTGTFEVVAVHSFGPDSGRAPLLLRVPVTVAWPAIERVEISSEDGRLYEGTTLRHSARAYHGDGSERPDAQIDWSTSAASVATVDRFGLVTAHGSGHVAVTAAAEGASGTLELDVVPFPGVSIELEGGPEEARTGDVVSYTAVVRDADGRPVADAPIEWSHGYLPPVGVKAPSAAGQIDDGKFVADLAGVFTVRASAGPLSARQMLNVTPRDAVRELQVVGHGLQSTMRTTDFWVFEGVNGRDYVITGSKVANGHAYVFDVTDPGNPVKTDSIQVDARAVNDVKVSPDGRYATMTREGASNRQNGVVILDLADPAHPVVASEYKDHGLTGGVHNAFPTDTHVFALSNGDKYVILDVADIYNPTFVSEYDHPDSRVHDVWVREGLAYSAEWGTGIVVVDVGDGRWGGSIENPKLVSTLPLTGSTHAVFPYVSQSTGKLYLFAGDERMSRAGLAWAGYPRSMGSYADQYDPETGVGGIPLTTRGYIQVVDLSDPGNPEMVARYEVSEFGTHNIWVENDVLYQAYYEGGFRAVDVSGELMGNLYTQGREIAVFKPATPMGYAPNATMVWSAMPFKGHVWFSDTNSGIWSVKILPKERPIS